MNTHGTIPDSDEAWEDETLGADEAYVAPLDDADAKLDIQGLDEALGLQPISIRLEKSLIEDFKAIATLNGLGYQTLMRQALKRFADCEKKRLLNEAAAAARSRASKARVEPAAKPAKPKTKKAA